MQTQDNGDQPTKARLFGDEASDELRRRVAKARFLQALEQQDSEDGVSLTDEGDEAGTVPSASSIEVERVRVGRFAVLRKLGQGGMGVVYAAYDEDLDRKVALKLIRQDLARDQRGRVRMQREAQALARLSHPNVVQVHEIGQWRDHDYVAMEFVNGHTFGAWLDACERRWPEVLDVMIQAGRGLAAAHAAGLVHRDFKPANLMVGEDRRARVLDFGLARQASEIDSNPRMAVDEILATDEGSRDETQNAHEVSASNGGRTSAFDRNLTATGAVLGTPAYMSPEQHLGQPATALSDQFSFCVVLYEGLFGRRPYEPGTRNEVATRVTEGEFIVPGPNTGVPAWLRKAVCRGLAPKPGDRWSSMDALLAELTRDRRRLWTRVGIAAGLLAALGTGLALADGDRGPVCEADPDGLHDIWGPDSQDAVRRAFVASGHGRAQARIADVTRTLDAYAQQLVDARTSSCTDHFVAQSQSDEQHALRQACLAQRERELAAIVDVLDDADDDVVEHVPGILASLGDIELCARVELLAPNVPAPKDADALEQIAQVRDELARAHVARQAGHLDEADALAVAARRRATQLAYAPLTGEVAYLEGANAFRRLDDLAAKTALLEAARLATTTGDLRLQATAALLEARVALRSKQGADYQLAVAEAAVAELGNPTALAVDVRVVRGIALRQDEQPDAALVEFDGAVARLRGEDYPGRDHQLADALLVRSASLSMAGREHESRDDLQEALALGLELSALDAVYDLGVVEIDSQNYDAAERLISLAVDGYARAFGSKYEYIGHGHLALAQIAMNRKDHDVAEQHIALALEVLDEGHPAHFFALNAKAALARLRGRHADAVPLLERALALASASGDAQDVADLRYQLGRTLSNLGRYEEAAAVIEPSIAAFDGDATAVALARPLTLRGMIERELGQLEQSRVTLERAVALVPVESGRPLFASEALIQLALTLERSGDHEAARMKARLARARIANMPGHHDILALVAPLLAD